MEKNSFYDRLSRHGETLLLWILCTVSISAVIRIYLPGTINLWSLLAAVMSAAVVLFLNYIKGRKKIGGCLYLFSMMAVSIFPSLAFNDRYDVFNFIRWFFSGSEAVETQTNYIAVLTVMMCFFFTSAAYYFVKIIYRSSIVTLLSLIPFALAVKTATILPYGYVAASAAVNIIIFVLNARKEVVSGSKPKGKAALMVYTDFTVAVILLALILPKPSVTPYYEQFEQFSNRFQFGGSGETVYTGEYKDISGRTDELRRGESVLIYIVSTKNPVYLKTQVFDVYDYEQDGWTEISEMAGSKKWQDTSPLLSYEKLAAAVEIAAETDPSVTELYPQAATLSAITENESYSIIYARDFPAVYVLAPLRAIGANLSNLGISYSARTKDGEIFTNLKMLAGDGNYTVRYYTEDVKGQLAANGFCDVTYDEYGDFLNRALLATDKKTEEYSVIRSFLDEHEHAAEYGRETEFEVSDEIYRLAEELTAGLEYDYEKAFALEQYFRSGDFTYDLNYEPPEGSDTPEFFLFESKRGICSDFATAYSLLAKAAGLTVRYTEGFVMQDSKTTKDMYYIYTDNAHAYPEVYIPGAGWMIFEPTPGDLTSRAGTETETEEPFDPLAAVFTGIIAVVVLGIFILLVILAPKIAESIFRLRAKLSDSNRTIILLYKRHMTNIEQKSGENCRAMTPEQLAEYTESITQLSLEPLTKPFIKTCYGGIDTDSGEKSTAFECYKAQYKALKKIKKRKD